MNSEVIINNVVLGFAVVLGVIAISAIVYGWVQDQRKMRRIRKEIKARYASERKAKYANC